MKKYFLALIAVLPFILTACFSQQATRLTLSEESLEMTVGDSVHVTVSTEPEGADAGLVTWSSSDDSVVTVDDGDLKAKANGTAVVTAESESGLKRSCNVTVNDKEIESVTISEDTTSVKVGSKIQLQAKTSPTDAPAGTITWKSSDTSVAMVNSDGYVTGVEAGVVNITCTTENGKEASCTVTVKATKSSSSESSSSSSSSSSASGSGDTDSYYQRKTVTNSTGSIYADCVFPYSSQVRLTESQAASVSSNEAQEGINEIYARHGYVFKTASIQRYFESKSWYVSGGFSSSDFNDVENYNIALLKKYV